MDGGKGDLLNGVLNEKKKAIDDCVQEDVAAMDVDVEEHSGCGSAASSTSSCTGGELLQIRSSCWRLKYGWRWNSMWVTSLRQSWFAQEVIHLTRLAVPNVS